MAAMNQPPPKFTVGDRVYVLFSACNNHHPHRGRVGTICTNAHGTYYHYRTDANFLRAYYVDFGDEPTLQHYKNDTTIFEKDLAPVWRRKPEETKECDMTGGLRKPPKFKVGDQVHVSAKHPKQGMVGTICKNDGGGWYAWRIDNGARHSTIIYHVDFGDGSFDPKAPAAIFEKDLSPYKGSVQSPKDFKQGDRVRIWLPNSIYNESAGEIVHSDQVLFPNKACDRWMVRIDEARPKGGNVISFHHSNLNFIDHKFKLNDRVRVSCAGNEHNGKTGIICHSPTGEVHVYRGTSLRRSYYVFFDKDQSRCPVDAAILKPLEESTEPSETKESDMERSDMKFKLGDRVQVQAQTESESKFNGKTGEICNGSNGEIYSCSPNTNLTYSVLFEDQFTPIYIYERSLILSSRKEDRNLFKQGDRVTIHGSELEQTPTLPTGPLNWSGSCGTITNCGFPHTGPKPFHPGFTKLNYVVAIDGYSEKIHYFYPEDLKLLRNPAPDDGHIYYEDRIEAEAKTITDPVICETGTSKAAKVHVGAVKAMEALEKMADTLPAQTCCQRFNDWGNEKISPWHLGGLLGAAFLIICSIPFWLPIVADWREISESRYEDILMATERYPETKPLIADALYDGKITMGEYRLIAEMSWMRDIRNEVKDDIIKVLENNQ